MNEQFKKTASESSCSHKKRIAVIGPRGFPFHQGGVENSIRETYKRLSRDPNLCISVYTRGQYNKCDVKNWEGLEVIHVPTIQNKYLDTLLYSLLASLHVLFKRYDIVHYYGLSFSFFSFLVRLFKKKSKLIISCRGRITRGKRFGIIHTLISKLFEIVSVFVPDLLTVVSENLKEYYLKEYNVSSVVISNGVDTIPASADSMEWLERYYLRPRKFFLVVSRVQRAKKIDLIIKAFNKLNLKENDCKLVFVGGLDFSDSYYKDLEKCKYSNEKIVFLGEFSRDKIVHLYANALAFISASESEGMPNTVLEAISYGLPVILSDIPAHLEITDSGKLATIFVLNDEEDLIKKINYVIDNYSEVLIKAQKAKEFVLKKYNWDDVAKKVKEIYLSDKTS